MTPYSGSKTIKGRARPRPVPGKMNQTEQAYADHLRLLMLAGEILSYEFEPLKLKLAAKQFWMFTFVGVQRKGANWSLEAF
ncbi:hypothetical protein [Aeromonas jandaei]|uniref:hypothetical protein n=1 Tax=Aeromonas jandaei TaxID=650 RepID=UPI001C04D1E4|nr:hypothetical protein [Aeromonas jandaei]QWL64879.1 hypothetical protein HQ398_00840 [Aeromonas jandaei]